MDSNTNTGTATDNQTSPRRLGTNMLNQQYLAPSRRESSFQLIKQELEDKILHDDDSVFQRLGIHHAPSDFVEACADSVTRNCGDKIETLQVLCKRAEGRDENSLENDEKQDAAQAETSGNQGSKEEKLMYEPLVRFQLYTEWAIDFIDTKTIRNSCLLTSQTSYNLDNLKALLNGLSG